MAEVHNTKRALAESLKELMEEKPFAKISIIEICGKCNMNRKSFYYHFKDKYELVNWIFDTDFLMPASSKKYKNVWDFLEDLANYFYENRVFYKKALCIEGQNSFPDYFSELLSKALRLRLQEMYDEEEKPVFQINFLADAYVMTFQRWILEYKLMTPIEFMEQLKACIQYIIREFNENCI